MSGAGGGGRRSESLDWGGGKRTSLRYTRKSRGLPRGVCVSLLLMQGRRWGAFRGQYPVKGDSVATKFTQPGGSSTRAVRAASAGSNSLLFATSFGFLCSSVSQL